MDRDQSVREVVLCSFLARYFERRHDVKPQTLVHWEHTRRCLLGYFGEDRVLSSITPAEAADFERWLKTPAARCNRYAENDASTGLAPNTVRKRISNAKQFFQDAVDREMLNRNPFAKLKGSVGGNRRRDFFVTQEMTQCVLDACLDGQWRLMVALARYGGLRCPTEIVALRWCDIDWHQKRMTVYSSKTEHHEGKASRLVPIFPELLPFLEAEWQAADEGQTYVITRYRERTANLRTQLQRIIARAGHEPWPKLWQNLRASRATELANTFPAHVAAAWMGHSKEIANKHHWQVTEEHFEQATQKAAQKAAQQVAASRGSEPQGKGIPVDSALVLPEDSERCVSVPSLTVGDEGLEPPTSTV